MQQEVQPDSELFGSCTAVKLAKKAQFESGAQPAFEALFQVATLGLGSSGLSHYAKVNAVVCRQAYIAPRALC